MRRRQPLAWALAALPLLAADEPARPIAPSTVAAGGDGVVWIADPRLPGIWRLEPGGRPAVAHRAGSVGRSPLRAVRALAVGKDGALFAADSAAGEVFRVEPGKPPSPLTGGALEIPTGLAVTGDGDLIVCDLRLGFVARIPQGGGAPVTIARVPAPRGVVSGEGGEVFVLSAGPDALLRVSAGGEVKPIVKGRPFRFPTALLFEPGGAGFLVSDSYAATVWSVSPGGEVEPLLKGEPLVRPSGLARDDRGRLLIADPGAGRVFRVGEDGRAMALGEAAEPR